MKFIELPNAEKRRLSRLFRVSNVTVWAALTYQTHSPLAERIREEARRAGGVEKRKVAMCADFLPDCTTEYLRQEGRLTGIVQRFANGVTVSFDCISGCALLCGTGPRTKRYDGVTLEQWPTILFEAQHMTDEASSP